MTTRRRKFGVGPMRGTGAKQRVFDAMLMTAASAMTSALAVTWRMSAMQTQMQVHTEGLESRVSHTEALIEGERAINVQQGTQLAVDQSTNAEILRRLSSIETKVDIQGARIGEMGARR